MSELDKDKKIKKKDDTPELRRARIDNARAVQAELEEKANKKKGKK